MDMCSPCICYCTIHCNMMVFRMEWGGRKRWRGGRGGEGEGGGVLLHVEWGRWRVCVLRKVYYSFLVSPSVVSVMTSTVLRRPVCSSWSSWPRKATTRRLPFASRTSSSFWTASSPRIMHCTMTWPLPLPDW